MHVAIVGIDRPGALELRKAKRAEHLAYADEQGCTFVAGPLIDENGDMIGSLIVLEVPDVASAQSWINNDPYNKANLFEKLTIREWKKARG